MKNTTKPNNDAGCSTVADKNTPTGGGEGSHSVRRVLWRSGNKVVYQDVHHRYLWADLERKVKRFALIKGGKVEK
jgi:hypothetical protein